jgi:phosphatidylglycerol:prolipoprotein diacylglycerol transferase
MRQTLFFIPHEIAGWPLFGQGWLLAAWLVVSLVWLAWLLFRPGGVRLAASYLPFLAVMAIAIAVVFPWLEAKDPAGNRIGLPVRGYGVLVLTGFLSGFGWSIVRARRWGISADTISSLAMWMLLAGFLGARLFFVIEYWDEFRRSSWPETLAGVVQFTEGGLIVYGALIAVLPALLVFSARHGLSPLVLGDVVAPGMVIGLAFGRLGCLMNGCCYGGVCDQAPWSVQFPHYNSVVQRSASPPYQHQLATGQLHGFQLGADPDTDHPRVESVQAGSAAEKAGLTAGARIESIQGTRVSSKLQAMRLLAKVGPEIVLEAPAGRIVRWDIGALPDWSLPVHPAQLYSSVGALLICLVLVASEPYLNRPGSLLALLLTLYPPVRIIEEMIRVDEPGQFGTSLKISQWISLGMLVAAAGLWSYVRWQKPASGDSAVKRRRVQLPLAAPPR